MFPESIPFNATTLLPYPDEREIWIRFAIGAMAAFGKPGAMCNPDNNYGSDYISHIADAMLEQYRKRYPMYGAHETR